VLPSKLWGNTGALTAISEEQHRQVVGVRFSLYRFFSVLGVRTHEVGRHLRGRERRRCPQTFSFSRNDVCTSMQSEKEGRSQLVELDESQ